MSDAKAPSVKKGNKVVLVAHGGHRIPATVLSGGEGGRIDLIASLPTHLEHIGQKGVLKVRGQDVQIDEEKGDHSRIVITSSPFDPTGTKPDSWHAAPEEAKPATPARTDPEKK